MATLEIAETQTMLKKQAEEKEAKKAHRQNKARKRRS